jgi:hypothetical protein
MKHEDGVAPIAAVVAEADLKCSEWRQLVDVESRNRDTSLATISAQHALAVLISAAPPLSANKADTISARIDCSVD